MKKAISVLDVVPLALTYSQKISEFVSTPPLLSIANLNISHAQRNADLSHALHVAAMPIMVIKVSTMHLTLLVCQ